MRVNECDHCHQPIEAHELLVPKWPRGSFHFHSTGLCKAAATRRAATVFPNVSGLRGKRVATPARPASRQDVLKPSS